MQDQTHSITDAEVIRKMNKDTKSYTLLRNNDGAVLVTALLMMVVLSIMSAFAMTVSMIEQKVTTNSEVFQHNFYSAEGVMLEGAAILDLIPDTTLQNPATFPGWLRQEDPIPSNRAILLDQSNQWPSALILPADTTLQTAVTNLTPAGYAPDGTTVGDRIWNAALDIGPCGGAGGTQGGNLANPNTTEQCYEIYGMYDVKRGQGKSFTGRMMMTVGYKKVIYSN